MLPRKTGGTELNSLKKLEPRLLLAGGLIALIALLIFPERSPAVEKRPHSDIHAVMYMTSWCPYCKKAGDLITSLGVSLTEYDIEKDGQKEKEMRSKSGGGRGVPLIDIEGIIIRGYAPDAIKAAVEKKLNPESR